MDLLDILDVIDLLAKLRNQTVKKFFLWIIWFLLVGATVFLLYKLILIGGALMLDSTTVYETEVSSVASPDVDFDTGEIKKPPYDVKYEDLSQDEKEFFNTIKDKQDSVMTVDEATFKTETVPPSLFTRGVTVCDDCGVAGDFELPEDEAGSGLLNVYGYYNINSSSEPVTKGSSVGSLNSTTYLILFILVLLANIVFYIKTDFSIIGIFSMPLDLIFK